MFDARILTRTPTIQTEGFRGFRQSIQVYARLVTQIVLRTVERGRLLKDGNPIACARSIVCIECD
jgi:hypothetical protein